MTDSATETVTPARPLQGLCVGISISESAELASLGLTAEAVNVITVDLARRIIALGGSVIVGHDWRSGGVMEAVSSFAMSYVGQNASPENPLIRNFLAAPDKASWSASDQAQLQKMVECKSCEWGESADAILDRLNPPGKYDAIVSAHVTARSNGETSPRALNLFAMRYLMAEVCDVRIVVGGKTEGYQGLAAGIVEEAWWQLALGKRLIVCTGMGGAALALAEPRSPAGERIFSDTRHPLATTLLEDIISTGGVRPVVVDSLRIDAILAAILPG
jgi:hypothetical protein